MKIYIAGVRGLVSIEKLEKLGLIDENRLLSYSYTVPKRPELAEKLFKRVIARRRTRSERR